MVYICFLKTWSHRCLPRWSICTGTYVSLELINNYLQQISLQTITDITDCKTLFSLLHICLIFTTIPRWFGGHPHVKVNQIMMGAESQKTRCHYKAMELLSLCGSEIISTHILNNKISRQSANLSIWFLLKIALLWIYQLICYLISLTLWS